MKTFFLILLTASAFQQVNALTPEAKAGKQLFDSCNACHNPILNPPLAPPMFAVKKKYSNKTADKQEFIDKIVSFVKQPTKQASLFPKAIEKLGMMPALGFSPQNVEKIATYIYENQFDYPCGHWKAGMEMAKNSGDMKHYNADKGKLQKFCTKHKNSDSISSVEPLKKLMHQLGLDFNQLSLAILAEDNEKMAKSAHAIAFHPEVLPRQKKTLKDYFGKEMKLFKQADMKVHKLSTEIEASAKEKNIKAVIDKHSQLLQACMDCHQKFRKRAIKALELKNSP